MTVKELIRELEKIENKDLQVIGVGEDEIDYITEVKLDELKFYLLEGTQSKQVISLLIGDYK